MMGRILRILAATAACALALPGLSGGEEPAAPRESFRNPTHSSQSQAGSLRFGDAPARKAQQPPPRTQPVSARAGSAKAGSRVGQPAAKAPPKARVAQAPGVIVDEPGAAILGAPPEPLPLADESVVDFGAACDDAYSRIYYVEADYLHWWISGDSAPPLVTTSTPGTPRLQAGVLGQPNTSVLFGGDDLDDDAHPGVRIVLGRWITPYAKIEGEWFDLGTVDSDFSAASNDIPILARPFFNVTSGLQDAFLVAYPGIREGAISVDSSTRFMGAAISVVENWDGACSVRDGQLALAFGLRYLRLEEDLSINDSFTSIDPVGPVPVGTSFTTSDNFDASNDFFGFNVGARTHWQHNRWSLACLGNVAIGQTIRRVSIAGQSTRTIPPGGTTTFNGGLLALPTNIGEYRNTELGVVPQIQVKLGYNVTHNIRLLLAYDGLLWSSVARAGDQIDTNVNLSQASGQPLVGQAAPLFPFRESNLWVHGVSGGVEWRF